MPTNDFLPFATGLGADVLDQATYTALPGRTSGFVAGVAQPDQVNKVWRQAAVPASMIAQFLTDLSGQNAVDDGNLAALLDNFKRAYRSQSTNYITAGGSGDAIILTPSPSVLSYASIAGTPIRMRASAQNTIANVTINISGLGTKFLRRRNLTALIPADLLTGMIFQIAYDQVADCFVMLGVGAAEVPVSTPAGVNPIIWVRPDGNDNNDGSANDAAHAMRQVAPAIYRGNSIYNLSGKTLDIRLGAGGFFDPVRLSAPVPAFSVTGSNASPGSFIFSAGTNPFEQTVYIGSSAATFSGVTFRAGRSDANCIETAYGGSISLIGNINITPGPVVGAGQGLLTASANGSISVSGVLTVSTNALAFASAVTGGNVTFQNGTTVIFSGGPNYSSAVVIANAGYIYASAGVGGVTWSGAASGVRANISNNGVVLTFGNPSSIPASLASSISSGGQFT